MTDRTIEQIKLDITRIRDVLIPREAALTLAFTHHDSDLFMAAIEQDDDTIGRLFVQRRAAEQAELDGIKRDLGPSSMLAPFMVAFVDGADDVINIVDKMTRAHELEQRIHAYTRLLELCAAATVLIDDPSVSTAPINLSTVRLLNKMKDLMAELEAAQQREAAMAEASAQN